MDRILMEIMGLSTSPSSGGAYALILNEQDGNRRLPIIIGTFEAQAIALELERIRTPRPMTHDLMKHLIEGLGAMVRLVYIHDLKDGTFHAQIHLDSPAGELVLDARPSDAIALAIRFEAAIYVSAEILDEAGIVSDAPTATTLAAEEAAAPTPEEGAEPRTAESRIAQLEKKLAAAIASEDYERAAHLRDEINHLKS